MNSGTLKPLLAVFGVAATIAGCATPVPPTGGPPDKTPPALVSSVPEPDGVNFSSDRISLTFSEPVDRASLQRALSFTPEIVLMPELRWDGQSVDLVFRGPLRESTTYIATLDNEFKDNRGVAISRPITLAFSTGPTIDKGRISGRVAESATGAPVERVDVLAFDETEHSTIVARSPSYRTQTDTDGTFSFSNLPQKRFFVVAVEDRNRNRMVDSTEAVALPSWSSQMPDTTTSPQGRSGGRLPTWFFERPDVIRPSVGHLQALSSGRIEIRFSERVRLDSINPGLWYLADTLTSEEVAISAVYQHSETRNRVFLLSDSLSPGVYSIAKAGVVRDSAGNTADVAGVGFFTASRRPDTTVTRFDGFHPESIEVPGTIDLGAGMSPVIRFNQFVDPSRPNTMVSASDAQNGEREVSFRSDDGTSWVLGLQPPATPGDSIRVEVTGVQPADTVYSAIYAYLGEGDTGSITGTFSDSAAVTTIQLFTEGRPAYELVTYTDERGTYGFGRLLKGSYRIRAFSDIDGDGKWSSGRLLPRRLPEPLIWHDERIEVRKGWESEVDTLRFDYP